MLSDWQVPLFINDRADVAVAGRRPGGPSRERGPPGRGRQDGCLARKCGSARRPAAPQRPRMAVAEAPITWAWARCSGAARSRACRSSGPPVSAAVAAASAVPVVAIGGIDEGRAAACIQRRGGRRGGDRRAVRRGSERRPGGRPRAGVSPGGGARSRGAPARDSGGARRRGEGPAMKRDRPLVREAGRASDPGDRSPNPRRARRETEVAPDPSPRLHLPICEAAELEEVEPRSGRVSGPSRTRSRPIAGATSARFPPTVEPDAR